MSFTISLSFKTFIFLVCRPTYTNDSKMHVTIAYLTAAVAALAGQALAGEQGICIVCGTQDICHSNLI